MIDLDEIDLAPTRSGSAKRIRSGKARAAEVLTRDRKDWRKTLRKKRKAKPITLAGSAR